MPRGKYARRRGGYRPRTSTTYRRFGRKRSTMVRKKRFSKYRLSGSSGLMRGTSSIGFPQRMFKTFTYSSGAQKLQQTIADLPVTSQFRGNSCYDPDYTGIGSQPRWYDTFMGATGGTQPYRQCTVLASKIIVSVWQDPTLGGATGSVAGVVSIIPFVGASTAPLTLKEIQERAFVRWRNIGNANSSAPLVVKHFAKTKALYQGVNPLNDIDNFQHDYNGNPNKQWYWAVNACNVINSGAGVQLFSCWITVRIKYYVMLSSLNDVADS